MRCGTSSANRLRIVLATDKEGHLLPHIAWAADYGLRRRYHASCPLVAAGDEVWACSEQNRRPRTREASPNVCIQTQSQTSGAGFAEDMPTPRRQI